MELNDLVRLINTMGTYLQIGATVWVGTLLMALTRHIKRTDNQTNPLDAARRAQEIERNRRDSR